MASIQIPEAFAFLAEGGHGAYRYRGAHGGRGGAKSRSFAAQAVIRARERRRFILCAREYQNSIADSIKLVVENQIRECGFGSFFRSTKSHIVGANGSRFIFLGMKTNPDSVKSLEGLDIVLLEEAQRISQTSFDMLEPTMRNDDSEIWAAWNPDSPKDPIDALLRGTELPPRAIVRQVNYKDNPFFPRVLREKMDWDRRRDPEKYAHIWLGGYSKNSESRVFKNWRAERFDTPDDVERFYFGADWGYSIDPSVLVRCWIKGRTLYIDREAYAVGCEIDNLPRLFAGKAGATPEQLETWSSLDDERYPGVEGATDWPITADSARPETIAYMQRHGFAAMHAAKKGPDSVKDGVEFLKTFDIVVHPDHCPNTVDELSTYSFKVDPKTNEVLPVLEDKKNHVIDSLRYAIERTRRATMFDVL